MFYKKIITILLLLSLLQIQIANSESLEGATPNQKNSNEKPEGDSKSYITITHAIQKALDASPRLKSAAESLEAALSLVDQSGYWPNPVIEIEAENIAGTGNFNGMDRAEITYGLSQRIELGGEQKYRKLVAKQSVMNRQFDLTIARLNLIRDVRVAYNNAVSAKEMMELAKERKIVAEAMVKTVKKRVEAAIESEIQLRKAEIGLSTAQLLQDRLIREFEHTKHVLTSLWTGHKEPIFLDATDFYKVSTPLTEEIVEEKIKKTADLKRWESEKNRTEALYMLAKAEAVPDLRITLGLRDLRATNDKAFVAGISFPLPLFNSNKGNIDSARSMISKVKSDKIDTQFLLQNEVFEWLERITNAYHLANTSKTEILPAAEQAFNFALEGYRIGRFSYLEVLDAQRILFEVKEQYIETLRQYQTAFANLERLTTPIGGNNE